MKNKKASLRREADKLWFRAYLKDCCEVCGKYGILQGHHFYYRSSYGHLRYNKENHITLCRGCHFVLHHQDPKKIEQRIIKKRGQKWYANLLKESRRNPASYQTISYYQEVIEKLKEK
jgi:5-methylcytosine-specific restriction endonuclease McrA